VPDELPDTVLIELGRLTWSAIHLEDLTDSLCHFVVHRDPREDRRPIGSKITEALRELRDRQSAQDVERIEAWLVRAREALERRNAFLHSVPLVLLNERGQKVGPALGEMMRRNRQYFERRMTAPAIREVREELDAACQGWRETLTLAAGERP
jgi:hypothetical protein